MMKFEYPYPYPYVSPNDITLSLIPEDLAFYIRKDKEFAIPFERHDGYEIYLFLEGDAQIFIEQKCYRLSRGDLYMILPDAYHRLQALPTMTYDRSVMQINTKYMNRLSTPKTDLTTAFLASQGSSCLITHLSEIEIEDVNHQLHMIKNYYKSDEFGSDLAQDAACIQLLLQLHKRFQSSRPIQHNLTPVLVEQAMEYIQKHISESMSINQLSHALFHDRSYISRLFKEYTGITLQQYIIIKKTTLAKQLLEHGLSITEVCFQSGFNNYSNFIRTFSQNTGISPAKYQKQHRLT